MVIYRAHTMFQVLGGVIDIQGGCTPTSPSPTKVDIIRLNFKFKGN